MTSPLDDPRVVPDKYIVWPTCADRLGHEKYTFGLTVLNGHEWGWSVQRGANGLSDMAMNRKGQFIMENRSSKRNRLRRYPLEEALALALKYVDKRKVMGKTAEEWADDMESRKA